MTCPYCGKEMRAGYVQGARGVFFSERERTVFFNPHRRERDVVIASARDGCSAPAQYCDGCRLLLAKTEGEEPPVSLRRNDGRKA